MTEGSQNRLGLHERLPSLADANEKVFPIHEYHSNRQTSIEEKEPLSSIKSNDEQDDTFYDRVKNYNVDHSNEGSINSDMKVSNANSSFTCKKPQSVVNDSAIYSGSSMEKMSKKTIDSISIASLVLEADYNKVRDGDTSSVGNDLNTQNPSVRTECDSDKQNYLSERYSNREEELQMYLTFGILPNKVSDLATSNRIIYSPRQHSKGKDNLSSVSSHRSEDIDQKLERSIDNVHEI